MNRTDKKRTVSAARYRVMAGKAAGNRKVCNAQKCEREGMMFDSKLERFMYDLLRMHGVRFERQVRYVLMDRFRYRGEAVRAVTYTADFYLPDHDMVVDTKGFETQQGKMRIKLLKNYFTSRGMEPRIRMPQNEKQCSALVAELLQEINGRKA